MSDRNQQVQFKCEALIDQGKYIGDDPVGHSCMKDSYTTIVDQEGMTRWVCAECYSYLENSKKLDNDHCFLPKTYKRQDKVIKNILQNLIQG